MESIFDDFFSMEFTLAMQNFVIALIILLVGWIIAKVIGNLVEKGLSKTSLDEKLVDKIQTGDKPINSNKVIGKAVYYILLVITFMLFFDRLNLTMLSSPLSDLISTFFSFIPAVLKAAIILIVAWILASFVRWFIVNGTEKAKIQSLLFKVKLAETKEDVKQFMDTLGQIAFYLIILVFIPGILDALNIAGVAQPFSSLVETILAFIPKLIGAAATVLIGWFIAKILKSVITNLLTAFGSEKLLKKLKLEKVFEGSSLAAVVGNIVFVIILIPVAILALEQLELSGISEPAVSMLNDIVAMIPNVLFALGFVLVGIWLGKLLGGFVSVFLTRVGFDRVTGKVNVGDLEESNSLTPSLVVGYVVQALIVFLLTVQALYIVKLEFLVDVASVITAYLPHLFAALLILGVALIVANLVEKVIVNLLSGPARTAFAGFAKYSILVLAVFMALTQLGIATTIVSSAFIIILSGLALAFGLAFGFGGKEFAAKYLEKFDHTIEHTNVSDTNKEE